MNMPRDFFKRVLIPGFNFLVYLCIQPLIFGHISQFLRHINISMTAYIFTLVIVFWLASFYVFTALLHMTLRLVGDVMLSKLLCDFEVSLIYHTEAF